MATVVSICKRKQDVSNVLRGHFKVSEKKKKKNQEQAKNPTSLAAINNKNGDKYAGSNS